MPRIHVVLCEAELELPNLPYLSLFHADDTLDAEIVRIFSSSESGIEIPQKDEDWSQVISKLRSQYLMGGPTAAQAVHYFDYLFPELARRIDRASDAGFSFGHQVELPWLLSLARLLDLRAKPQWLREKLEVACHAEGLDISTRNKFQNNLGTSYVYSGKWDHAASWISKAIEGCKEQGDLAGLAMGFGNLALLEIERGDVHSASTWLQEGRVALARAANQLELQPDRNLLMEVLGTEGNLNNHEGRINARLGAFERAYVCFANHLAITESLENRNGIGVALGWIAYTDILSERTTLRTTMALRRYMSLSIESFNPRGAANAHAWNGQACIVQGDFSAASGHFKEEAKLRKYLNDELGTVRALAWTILTTRRLADGADILTEITSDLTEAMELVVLTGDDVMLAAEALADPCKLNPASSDARSQGAGMRSHPALARLLKPE